MNKEYKDSCEEENENVFLFPRNVESKSKIGGESKMLFVQSSSTITDTVLSSVYSKKRFQSIKYSNERKPQITMKKGSYLELSKSKNSDISKIDDCFNIFEFSQKTKGSLTSSNEINEEKTQALNDSIIEENNERERNGNMINKKDYIKVLETKKTGNAFYKLVPFPVNNIEKFRSCFYSTKRVQISDKKSSQRKFNNKNQTQDTFSISINNYIIKTFKIKRKSNESHWNNIKGQSYDRTNKNESQTNTSSNLVTKLQTVIGKLPDFAHKQGSFFKQTHGKYSSKS